MTQKDTLTGRELKMLEAILDGASIEWSAKAAGVSRRTAYRMAERPLFKEVLRQRQSEALDLVVRRLLVLATGAVDALASVLEAPAQSGATNKRMAAVAVLTVLHEWRELVDYERRLSELEDKIDRGQNAK